MCQESTDKPLALFVGLETFTTDRYEIARVRTCEEALAYLASRTPALMLVSLHLLDTPGMDLLQQIRAEERLAGMEVIVTGDLPPSTKMGE
jgi:DNA-binding response OmpR family regulator